MVMICIFVFIFGLVLGSFVNALEYRINTGMSIRGRSMCPNCKHGLVWYDLIPVVSWVLLRRKCRYCHESISPQYPIIELISGFSLVILVSVFMPITSVQGLSLPHQLSFLVGGQEPILAIIFALILFLLICVFSTILILLALHDYKTSYVLSVYVYVALLLAIILRVYYLGDMMSLEAYLPYMYSAIGAALPFGLIWLISRGKWMGAGDIELALLVGLFLGWPGVVVGLYFSFIVGSIVGVSLIVAKKSHMKSEISFGPFMVAGIYFALLFSQQITDTYVRIFLG